jgi:hypothetical protein
VAVAVLGVINTIGGVSLTSSVAVFSGVGVGDFKPTKVGVNVNVSVGVTGVADGTGVYVFVGVSDGVGVGPKFREKLPTVQASDRMAQIRMINIFFMARSPV